MLARRRLLLTGAAVAFGARAGAQPAGGQDHLEPIDDLRPLLAQVRQRRVPLLVLFSTPGCPYCREVRRSYLVPRVAEQAAQSSPTLLIREVDITSRAPLTDLQGRRTTQAEFASRFGVRVVPVVALLDDRGQLLGEPLVGIDRSGFYETYLARAIEAAERRLRS
ncbi:MAG TPA: thioredoxin fold domain-containing protein [Burkholderiaceae bacterium]|nr:thioredoxin fold domain-containing protein [Burkholderiaceae bacterium]